MIKTPTKFIENYIFLLILILYLCNLVKLFKKYLFQKLKIKLLKRIQLLSAETKNFVCVKQWYFEYHNSE